MHTLASMRVYRESGQMLMLSEAERQPWAAFLQDIRALGELGWLRGAVIHPGIRTLLLWHLARRPADHEWSWAKACQRLRNFTPVSGASGVITIGNDGPTTGDAIGKPLVIMQHLPGGEACRGIEVP
jgi:hypothetical protein